MERNFCVFTYLFWISILLLLYPSLVVAQSCTTSGWFGDNCQYKCHCTNDNCDFTTGECGDSSACVKGWFGPACQYVDLTTTMTTGTGWLYDGDDITCNDDGQQSVTVQLNDSVPFTWLRLYVNDPGNTDTYDVKFQTSTGNVVSCSNQKTAAVGDHNIDIYCDLDNIVQNVTVTGQGVRSLCSVYISGGRNVALRQSTTQSTTFPAGLGVVSSNAVDSNRDGRWYGGSCTQTSDVDYNPYWSVTLSYPQTINRYVLYNRIDAVPERLLYFNLTSYTADDIPVFNYQDQKTEPQDVNTVIPDVTSTSPVSRVTIAATYIMSPIDRNPVLTLCEVETYGDTVCPQGTYGRECEHSCDYCRNQICFVSTGGCPDGCDDGYIGAKCQTSCPATYYGQDCKQRCNINCMDQLCDNVHGVCNSCLPGKRGEMCDQACPATYYGQDCKQRCNINCMDQLCDNVHGVCNSCLPGKRGEVCDQVCGVGTYGQDCKERCNEHCKSPLDATTTSCDPVNGTCVLGCVDGFVGSLCQSKYNPSSESVSPDLAVGIGIGVGLMVVVVIAAVGAYCYWRRSHDTKSGRQRPTVYHEPDFGRRDEHIYGSFYDHSNLPTDEFNPSIATISTDETQSKRFY